MEPSINSALSKGLFQQIRFLIEFGQDVNARDEERRTPMMNCAFIEDIPWGIGLARLFIEKGAAINHRDKRGLNAMQYASIYNRVELAKIYLKSMDFDLNQGDRLGNTALHYAASLGHEELTRLLLETHKHYQISVDKPNKRGATPLLLAWRNRRVRCARLLTELGEADDTLVDPIERKSPNDYENELMGGDGGGPGRAFEELSVNVGSYEGRRPPARPKTAVGGGGPAGRPRSAVPLGSRRERVRAAALQSTSLTNLQRKKVRKNLYGRHEEEEEEEEEMFRKEKLAARLIRSASLTELRNRPDYIFQVTPMDCFVNPGHRLHQARRALHSAESRDDSPGPSWRSDMGGLYKNYDFQFTKSFLKGAVPPDPETLRPVSPNPSDCTSEAISDRAPSGAGRKLVRKPSMSNMSKILEKDKNKKSAKQGSGRRGSIVQVGIPESSSNESITSNTKSKRRSSQDIHEELPDVTNAAGIRDKGKDKKSPRKDGESRPGSRTGHHVAAGGGKEARSMRAIKE